MPTTDPAARFEALGLTFAIDLVAEYADAHPNASVEDVLAWLIVRRTRLPQGS
jgi:hypothetical protein